MLNFEFARLGILVMVLSVKTSVLPDLYIRVYIIPIDTACVKPWTKRLEPLEWPRPRASINENINMNTNVS